MLPFHRSKNLPTAFKLFRIKKLPFNSGLFFCVEVKFILVFSYVGLSTPYSMALLHPISVVVKDIVTKGVGSITGPLKLVANGSPPPRRFCVTPQTLSGRDGPRHSLHASTLHREYDGDLIFDVITLMSAACVLLDFDP